MKTTNLKHLLASLVAMLVALSVNAEIYSGSCGRNLSWSLDTSTGLLDISGTGAMTNYTSGAKLPWANYRSSITSVKLPSGLSSIGNYAFSGCSGLTSITIPSSVTSIGSSVFADCSGLTSITLSEGLTSIGYSAFYGCTGLTSITIPSSVTSIGNEAFYDCTGLTSITIPEGVTSIKNGVFQGCSGLISITIPEGVTSIGEYAFSGCSGLTSVTIPESVTTIGDFAFFGCSGLTKAEFASIEHLCSIKFGSQYSNPLYNAKHLFINGKEITEMVIPESVTSIGNYAFDGCKGLTSVSILEGVTSIGSYAFYGCSGLTSITIPKGVTSIGGSAFSWCEGLTSITLPEGLTSIGNQAFYCCEGLTSITIPEGVTTIGDEAFRQCYTLTSMTIPESVTSIGDEAFYHCTGLTSITIPESVTSIGYCAFYACFNLKGIEYNGNCTTAGMFADMASLQEVKIGDNVTTLYNGMFSGCTGLQKVTLGKGLKYIRNDAFKGCTKLDTVTCRAETPPYCYPDVFANVSLASCTLEVPKGAGEAYKTTAPWKEFGRIIEFMEPDEEGYYHLSTVEDVEWFSAMVNEKHQGWINAKLDNDIDFGGVPNAHQPIGTSNYKYAGHFDGQGHRILNMIITPEIVLEQRSFDGVGFFGSLRSESQSNWEVPTTECIVENLIIDSSCSISYSNRWVGGIAGHIYGGTGSVTIRNCGNEATISAQTTSEGYAGILGVTEETAMTLNITNCWNTGNISSTSGKKSAGIFGGNIGSKTTVNITNCMNVGNIAGKSESSAICGWMGSNTGNRISGCYNIGEVSGMEKNLSLFRGTAEATNLYDITTSAQDGKATLVSNEMVTGGELCYLLNGKQSDDVIWYQTLGEDKYPVLSSTSKVVFRTAEGVYTNDANGVEDISKDESAEAAVYDLTGRRVQNTAKGLYIIKGRKVLVK